MYRFLRMSRSYRGVLYFDVIRGFSGILSYIIVVFDFFYGCVLFFCYFVGGLGGGG